MKSSNDRFVYTQWLQSFVFTTDNNRVPMTPLCSTLHVQAWTVELPPCLQMRWTLELSLDLKECQQFTTGSWPSGSD